MFPPDKQGKADAVLGSGKFAPGYKREYFKGCGHGFTVCAHRFCVALPINLFLQVRGDLVRLIVTHSRKCYAHPDVNGLRAIQR
ncbi:hypothetical protein FA95DRAFT_1552670 [Auriscalpium vulgare]|uniref:Uncharacterized protein n=1 Tax=Auriscalpium vulgare TaxID=40419 RepID=A0ACB8SB94_9AGAM|nr:hypothetical protein FA95DRAFT_1552670 [Auriscalpium vulgare]